jgi:hypothetical protein
VGRAGYGSATPVATLPHLNPTAAHGGAECLAMPIKLSITIAESFLILSTRPIVLSARFITRLNQIFLLSQRPHTPVARAMLLSIAAMPLSV